MARFSGAGQPDGRYRLEHVATYIDMIGQKTGKVRRSFTTLPGGNWLAIDADGFYTASPGAHEYLRLTSRNGFKSIPVSRDYKAAFFRPNGLTPASQQLAGAE